jgi:hypothetical protein
MMTIKTFICDAKDHSTVDFQTLNYHSTCYSRSIQEI